MTDVVYKLVRYIAFVLEIFVFFMFQETPGLLPQIFGVRPILVIPVVLTISMFEMEIPSLAFGVFGGLLIDFGLGAVLGFHALLLGVLCFVVSILSRTVLQINLGTSLISGVWTVAVIMFLVWFFQYLLAGYSGAGFALVNHYLPQYLYTLLMFPVMFVLNRLITVMTKPRD